MRALLPLTGAALLAAGLTAGQQPQTARAELVDAQGRRVGTATLTETPHGVLLWANFTALPAGTHAFHVHQVGRCEPPFDSAGGHFNPGGRRHGFRSPEGPHAGDMPNLHVPESGRLEIEILLHDATLAAGPRTLLDADGSALVVHAGTDDYMTDPAGNSGARIACGVVRR